MQGVARVCQRQLSLSYLYVLVYFVTDACLLLLCLISFFSTKPTDWLGRTSPKSRIMCRVGRITSAQSVSQIRRLITAPSSGGTETELQCFHVCIGEERRLLVIQCVCRMAVQGDSACGRRVTTMEHVSTTRRRSDITATVRSTRQADAVNTVGPTP